MAAPLSEIFTILREVLRKNDIEFSPATRFDDLTGWDSMDLVTVIVTVECRFGLQFTLLEIERLVTVGDLLRAINVKQALAAA